MSTPETKSATPEDPKSQDQAKPNEGETPSLEEQLATETKRRKDTQSGYTKSRQELKAVEAERDKLLELLSGAAKVEIPAEDKERLDTLMYEDPAAWRTEMNSLENKSISESRAKIAELTGTAKEAAEQTFELDRRQQVLKEFNESAEVVITEELIADEVPPRITKKLAEGKISFEDFLQEVATYVGKGKVIKNDKTLDQPNLSDMGGSNTPSDTKPEEGVVQKYKKVIY